MTTTIQNQTFGFEMEFYGMTRERATRVIAEVLGGTAQTYTRPYYATDSQGRKWKVVYDGSIKKFTRGEACEMVTPILKYDDIEMLQEVIRALRENGAGVNDTCGIHIHVGADRHSAKSLKNLVNIMYSKQDILYRALKMHDERSSRWAKKIGSDRLARFNKKFTSVNEIGHAWYDGAPSNHQVKYDSSRYHGLNLHSVFFTGTVEFRLFNSTTHAGRAKAYIQFCLAVSALAINSKSSRSAVTASTNEKYTFRTWLLRLGLNGEEFKTCRTHMLANLEGDIAWRNAQ